MISNKLINLKVLLSIFFLTLLNNVKSQTFVSDFSIGYDGWSADFADYPITDSLFYELEFYRTTLPSPLATNQYSLLISGNNHSDDLFMFLKRKIKGLLPNTTYQLLISVDFASKYPTNAVGVGGAPGEGVTIKAGASIIEPMKVIQDSYYRINIDKDDQDNPGADMDTIGHVGVTDTTTVYTIINRNNAGHLFNIKTDSNGEVWICIGTDSGFEATTTLYYKNISLTFNTTTDVNNDEKNPLKYSLLQNYPNPFNSVTVIKYSIPKKSYVTLIVYNILGNEIASLVNQYKNAGEYEAEFNAKDLPSGFYLYELRTDKFIQTRKLLLLK